MLNIAITVAVNLGNPVIGVRPRNPVATPAIVTVPPAAMHENHGAASRKHQVRPARQILHVQPISIACSVKQTADGPFWLRILGLDRLHGAPAQSLRRLGHRRRIGVGLDVCCTTPSGSIDVVLTTSLPWLATTKRVLLISSS